MYAYGQMKYPQASGLALISPPPSAKEMTTFLTGNKEYERAKLEAQEALARGDEYHLIVCKAGATCLLYMLHGPLNHLSKLRIWLTLVFWFRISTAPC